MLVISSFPPQGQIHAFGVAGAATYLKEVLLAMSKISPSTSWLILADKTPESHDYREARLHVKRFWQADKLKSLAKLLPMMLKHRREPVLVSFEVNMFGSWYITGFTLLIITLGRLLGVRIYFILHQVVTDFAPLTTNRGLTIFKNLMKSIFYFMAKLCCTKLIVFENSFKQSLGGSKKIIVIPHAIQRPKPLPKATARHQLNWSRDTRYLLFFGYLAPYKGLRELLKIWPTDKKIKLIIAGSMSPNAKYNMQTAAYVLDIEKLAHQRNLEITGFVNEKDIPLYFSACDGVIFPYRLFMSSSGPLAFALAYQQPFILSAALKNYTRTTDFAAALTKNQLTAPDFIFQPNSASLTATIRRALKQTKRWQKFSSQISKQRSLENIANTLLEVCQ